MKIGFFEIKEQEKESIKNVLLGHDLFFSEEKIDEDDLPEEKDFDIISVFVNSRVTSRVINELPNLKLIVTRSTGYDHIDLSVLKEREIKLAYVPNYGDNTVAEFAFGLLLNITRKIYQGISRVKETGQFSPEGLCGIDLKGKTIGVIGTGRIGREAIKIAKGFDMRVIATDIFPNNEFAKDLEFEYVSLEELLKQSDVITIHCPLTEETKHLINKENIGLIKRGAYLVNTARGGIVETDALLSALKEGILAGVALDVLEEEEEIKYENKVRKESKTTLENHALIGMPNVLITPHNAFNSQEALERILNTTLQNIREFITGKPINLVQ